MSPSASKPEDGGENGPPHSHPHYLKMIVWLFAFKQALPTTPPPDGQLSSSPKQTESVPSDSNPQKFLRGFLNFTELKFKVATIVRPSESTPMWIDHLRMQLICFCDSPSCCAPSSLANLGGDFEHPARILYLFHDFLYAKSIGLLIIQNDNANRWGSAVGSRVEGFSYSLLFFVLFTTSLFINIMLNINETF